MRTHLYSKGLFLILFLSIILNAQTVSVPTQYSTVAQALQFGTDILVTANITENIVISSMTVSITGADTNITITGKSRISNSTVTLQTIKFLGRRGSNGISPNPGYTYCPTAGDGADGDTALIVTNSTIRIINSTIKGGGGGTAGASYYYLGDLMACDCGNGGNGGLGLAASNSIISVTQSKIRGGDFGPGAAAPYCDILRGSQGIAINASQYTTIDTMQVVFESVVLDPTSHIIPGTSVVPSARKELKIPSVRFLPSGAIMVNNFDNSTDLTVAVYSMAGRLIYTNALKGRISFVPRLDRGVYLVTITNGKQKVCGKFVKIK
jgi:hypothetical protein